MPFSRSFAPRARTSAVVLASTAVAFAGCGGKSDISQAEKTLNAELKKQGLPVRIDCPKEVGSEAFNCDVKSTKDETKSTAVKFELTGKDEDTLDVADQKAFQKALLAAGS